MTALTFDPDLVLPSMPKPGVNGHSKPGKTNQPVDRALLDLYQDLWEADVDQPDELARLVFLLAEYRIKIPNALLRYIPLGRDLAKAHQGPGSIASLTEIAPLYRQGRTYGQGSRQEVCDILFRLVSPKMSSLHPQDQIIIYKAIDSISQNGDTTITSYGEIDFGTEYEHTEIEKFESGFRPIDLVTRGLYQSLVIMMGNPGTGKTSIMLTFMEELIRSGHECWFFENEIPLQLMMARSAPIRERLGQVEGSKLFCGPYDIVSIGEMVRANPNPNRIIFFDSPDVYSGVSTGERRFDMEEAYKLLIQLKMDVKMVVVASQPRRADSTLSMKSVAESWAKAWYCDIMLGIEKNGFNSLRMSVLKNRFGPNLRNVYFQYDYANLSWFLADDGQADWDDIPGQITEEEKDY